MRARSAAINGVLEETDRPFFFIPEMEGARRDGRVAVSAAATALRCVGVERLMCLFYFASPLFSRVSRRQLLVRTKKTREPSAVGQGVKRASVNQRRRASSGIRLLFERALASLSHT